MLKNVKSDRFATLPGVTKNYGGLDSSDSRTKTKKKIIEYEYYDEDYDYYDDFYVPAQPRRRQSYGGGGKLKPFTNHCEFLEIPKKVFGGFDNIFHVYLKRGFQKYGRN